MGAINMSSCGFGIFILVLISVAFTSAQSSCTVLYFYHKNLEHCKRLNTLGAEFGWSIRPSNRSEIGIFFGVKLHADSGWAAWGVNPGRSPQMVGTRALIGIRQPNETLILNTYNITSDTKLGCRLQPSEIDIPVLNKSISCMAGYCIISATLMLSPSIYNISKLNHVWQVGYLADGAEPKMHPTTLQNVDSTETINLNSGKSYSNWHQRRHLRVVHGILNMAGWGTLLPLGAIIARYFRMYPIETKQWYTIHVSCQVIGYSLGTIGWAIGLWLGHVSKYYAFGAHRILGIFIFTFATLQALALRLTPSKSDDYRKFWNMYHHCLGYSLLVLISVNIFQGIDILKPAYRWKWAYTGVLASFAAIILVFEFFTWTKFIKEKKEGQDQSQSGERTAPQQVHQASTVGGGGIGGPHGTTQQPGGNAASAGQAPSVSQQYPGGGIGGSPGITTQQPGGNAASAGQAPSVSQQYSGGGIGGSPGITTQQPGGNATPPLEGYTTPSYQTQPLEGCTYPPYPCEARQIMIQT